MATDPEENLTALWIYHNVPAQVGHDRAAYRRLLVDRLFSGMLNARLYERGREADPPFLAAGSGRSLLVGDAATLYMAAYLDKDRIPRGLDTLLEEMQRVAQHGFTATELEREKANMLRAIESAWHERDQRPSQRLAEEYLPPLPGRRAGAGRRRGVRPAAGDAAGDHRRGSERDRRAVATGSTTRWCCCRVRTASRRGPRPKPN